MKFLALMIILALALLVGCGDTALNQAEGVQGDAAHSEEPIASQPTHSFGETTEAEGLQITPSAEGLTQYTPDYAETGEDYSHVWQITVLLENVGSDLIPYGPADFQVQDTDAYLTSGDRSGMESMLKEGELQPGDQVRGLLLFWLEEGSGREPVTLIYHPWEEAAGARWK